MRSFDVFLWVCLYTCVFGGGGEVYVFLVKIVIFLGLVCRFDCMCV